MKKERFHNLIVIAGTGRESGKTTLACLIIEKFRHLEPIAIKISSHFHEPTEGLINWHINDNFNIYLETSRRGSKDTTRMLNSGAAAAYYIQAYDKNVLHAFRLVASTIPEDIPVICESPSLIKYIKPGVIFITDNKQVKYKKDIAGMLSKADYIYHPLTEKVNIDDLDFSGGSWIFG
ncbi:MAG: hypothetical protein JW965_05190 [Bacteroidales bacterium]|nr:hypothetical protein [Bacteroidales bacterium]